MDYSSVNPCIHRTLLSEIQSACIYGRCMYVVAITVDSDDYVRIKELCVWTCGSHACTSRCERANVSIWLPDCQNLPFASCASFELPLPLRDSCRNIRSISHVSPMRIERPSKAWFHAEMEDASLTHIWRISSTWEGCWYSAIVFLKHTSFILFHSFWKRTFVSAGHLYLRSMPWKVAVINKSDRTQLSQKSKCIYVSFSIRLMYRVSRSMYSIYVSMHPCIYGSMHVCTYGRTDGWMDGWIYSCMAMGPLDWQWKSTTCPHLCTRHVCYQPLFALSNVVTIVVQSHH